MIRPNNKLLKRKQTEGQKDIFNPQQTLDIGADFAPATYFDPPTITLNLKIYHTSKEGHCGLPITFLPLILVNFHTTFCKMGGTILGQWSTFPDLLSSCFFKGRKLKIDIIKHLPVLLYIWYIDYLYSQINYNIIFNKK